jgi:hypothetical protein
MSKTLITAGLLAAAAAVPISAAATDRALDDLAAVRRAVASTAEEARPPAEATAPAERRAAAKSARPRRAAGEAQWLRLKVVEKGEKHARVSLRLPLALVRSAGEDWRLPDCDGCRRFGTTLGELLRALRGGESLLEIDDDEAVVRIWIE